MKNIYYGKQFINNSDLISVKKSLLEDKITTGNFVDKFENGLKKYLDNKYIKVCNSGTAALHLAYIAAGLNKKSTIIMPSVNFISAYRIAKLIGMKVFLADVDQNTGQMKPDDVISIIKNRKLKKIDAILNMYLGGFPENIKDFYYLKKKYNSILIEDACHAFGASYKINKKVYKIGSCKHSDISIFSFHPLKTITTGEGGAISLKDKKRYDKINNYISHGILRKRDYWNYNIKHFGMNYRLSDINCALGVTQLKKISYILSYRKKIYFKYKKLLKKFSNFISLNNYSLDTKPSYHLMIVHFKMKNLKCKKNKIFDFFRKNKIFLQQHYIPIYKFDCIKTSPHLNSEKYISSSISLPIHVNLTTKDISRVVLTIKNFIKKYGVK